MSDSNFNELLKFGEEFINNIIEKKYCLNGEKSYFDVINRIINKLKICYPNRLSDIGKIYEMIDNKRYIPGGSISYGVGNNSKVSLSNCYYIPIKSDSIEGIYECKKEIARVFSYRGGAGIDISVLRPFGSEVNNAAITSSGSVSFLPEFSETTRVIGQCLAYDSLVLTKNGLKEIQYIKKDDFVWTLKGWIKVLNVFKNKKIVYETQSKLGYIIKASKNHVFKLYDNSEKKLKDLKLNHHKVMMVNGPKESDFELEYQNLDNENYLDCPNILDEKLAYILGYIFNNPIPILDFSLSGNNTVEYIKFISFLYYRHIPDFGNKLYQYFKDVFNYEVFDTEFVKIPDLIEDCNFETECIDSRNHKYMIDFLESNIFIKDDDYRLPKIIFRSPVSVQSAFISGLIDSSERNFLKNKKNKSKIFITMACKEDSCANDLQSLLLSLGFITKLSYYNEDSLHIIEFIKTNSLKLKEFFKESIVVQNFDNSEMDEFKSKSDIFFYDTLVNKEEYFDIDRLCREDRDADDVDLDDINERIVDTYDLQLEDEHLFWCNGFYVHNSGRRAALLISIDCRHPDLLKFVWCKSKSEEIFNKDEFTGYVPNVNYANLTVKLTNDFFKAVENDEDWTSIFPDTNFKDYDTLWDGNYDKWIEKGYPVKEYQTLKARDILMQISESAWISGDPGVSYFDHVIDYSPMSFDPLLKPAGFNPCGEQTLPNYGNCLLSSLVLYKYVSEPFTNNSNFDMDQFLDDASNGIIFLDLLVDYNKDKHPLLEQRKLDSYSRRVGQEITGLADCLAMLGIEYGSDESIEFIDDIFHKKAIIEIETSVKLAKEFGMAECFKSKNSRINFLKSRYIKNLFSKLVKSKKESLTNLILEHGLRNAAFNTLGPTGTLSIIADNCTSGIEPLYGLEYFRETRFNPGKKNRIIHYPLLKYVGPNILNLSKDEIKKKYNYKEAFEIDYKDRIKIQSTIQKYTDNSISSTINLPEDITIKDIYEIYLLGHKEKLKGITIFRNNSKKGILSLTDETTATKEVSDENARKIVNEYISKMKEKLLSPQRAYRVVVPWKKSKVYTTITYDDYNRPVELFASVPKEAGHNDSGEYDRSLYDERSSYWTAICRLVSLSLRAGINLYTIIDQLSDSGESISDLPNSLSRVLRRFLTISEDEKQKIIDNKTGGAKCPLCGENGIVFQNGCSICLLCGNSSCS
jgi:ribonucleotide reductase alpha subunit/intein/homing endonuclease